MSVLVIILVVLAVCLLCYLLNRITMTAFAHNVCYIVLAVLTLLFILWQTGLLSNLGTVRTH
jgi:hypothetical protein